MQTPRTIIAAIDPYDDHSRRILQTAKMLADKFDASLSLLAVAPPIPPSAAVTPIGHEAALAPLEDMDTAHEKQRLRYQTALEGIADSAGCGAGEQVVLTGAVDEEICRYANRLRADLLVIGAHRRKFLGKLLTPSTSKRVAAKAPCAVYLVPEVEDEK